MMPLLTPLNLPTSDHGHKTNPHEKQSFPTPIFKKKTVVSHANQACQNGRRRPAGRGPGHPDTNCSNRSTRQTECSQRRKPFAFSLHKTRLARCAGRWPATRIRRPRQASRAGFREPGSAQTPPRVGSPRVHKSRRGPYADGSRRDGRSHRPVHAAEAGDLCRHVAARRRRRRLAGARAQARAWAERGAAGGRAGGGRRSSESCAQEDARGLRERMASCIRSEKKPRGGCWVASGIGRLSFGEAVGFCFTVILLFLASQLILERLLDCF